MDPLMGIGNRRALISRLDDLKKKKADRYSVRLMILDIDDFKIINDNYGHICGDEVLICLGEIIKEKTINQKIEAYRYGGEEIVLLFLNMKKEDAVSVAEDIRETFQKTTYSFDARVCITLSGGIAEMNPAMSSEEMIDAADARLYLAKKSGKNRILSDIK